MPSSLDTIWAIRTRLGPTGRRRVRAVSDLILRPLGSVREVTTTRPEFAITFDDGPDPVWTPAVMEILDRERVRGTFFMLANRARQFPGLVSDVVSLGHEIALHGEDHTRLTTLGPREVVRRMARAKHDLEKIADTPVKLFRPPFGAQSIMTYLIARHLRLEVVMWGPHAEDWVHGSPSNVAHRALGKVHPGDILLLHDGLEVPAGQPIPRFDKAEMVRLLLKGLAEDGLNGVTVSQLRTTGPSVKTAWFRP